MKKLILFFIPIILLGCNSEKEKNKLEKSLWKFSDGPGYISDVLDFRKDYSSIKNDSIYINWHKKDSLVGTIDKIEYYYGERRLYIKDLKGNVGRYCEQ